MKIQIKHSFNSSILFEHECQNNTIKKTLIQGVKTGANLYCADLQCANLYGADLRGADLYGADLRGANLYGANLYGANLKGANLYGANLKGATLYGATLYGADLRGANLYCADLRGADLYGADLRGANLYGANLYGANLKGANFPLFSKWNTSIINNRIIKIGCKKMTIEDWDLFFASEEEFETKRGTADFKQIEAMYLAYKAYLTHLNS